MNLSPKELVHTFYNADLIHNEQIISDCIHPEVTLHWNSSFGYFEKGFDDLVALFEGMKDSFEFSRNEITHLFSQENSVTIRHVFYAKPIENQTEIPVSTFICIWELKDDKLHTGHMISQLTERE